MHSSWSSPDPPRAGRTPSGTWTSGSCRGATGTRFPGGKAAFTLAEILAVLAIATALIGLIPLILNENQRARRAAIAELRGALETARALAMGTQTDVYVAFSDQSAPRREDRFTRYALFVPRGSGDPSASVEPDIFQRELVAVSNWFRLPEGILLALGSEFEARPGEVPVQTVLDAGQKSPALKRGFPFLDSETELKLPFFLFNSRGQLELPPVYCDSCHHVGVVEAALDERASSAGSGEDSRTYLGFQTSPLSRKKLPRTELIRVNPHHGRTIYLTASAGSAEQTGQAAPHTGGPGSATSLQGPGSTELLRPNGAEIAPTDQDAKLLPTP